MGKCLFSDFLAFIETESVMASAIKSFTDGKMNFEFYTHVNVMDKGGGMRTTKAMIVIDFFNKFSELRAS